MTDGLDWTALTSRFSIMSGADALRLKRMERHQDLEKRIRWLDPCSQPPIALLFVSHRWETLAHPDPTGRQLAAVQELLRKIVTAVEAMLGSRGERLRLIPALEREGDLQAVEIVRRMFGYGPFAVSEGGGEKARATTLAEHARSGSDSAAFCDWLTPCTQTVHALRSDGARSSNAVFIDCRTRYRFKRLSAPRDSCPLASTLHTRRIAAETGRLCQEERASLCRSCVAVQGRLPAS